MKKIETIKKEWNSVAEVSIHNRGFQRILWGLVEETHYREFLKQLYFYNRSHPQVHALTTVYFRGSQRKSAVEFYKYSIKKTEECNLLIHDLTQLDEDIEKVRLLNPLPTTSALIAFAYYQIQHANPVGYLGCLFHAESFFKFFGKEVLLSFEKKGISRQAMSYLCEEVIVNHNQDHRLEKYIDDLVLTSDDLDAVIYSARSSAYLFGQLIDQAISCADQKANWGKSFIEFDYQNDLKKFVEMNQINLQ